MLDDPMLVPRAADIVREQRVNAEWAVQQVSHEFSAVFDEVADPYLRERKGDVLDLVGRLRMNLSQGVATRARAAARARRVVDSDRRRADAVDRRAGGLDESPRLRDRRRQPHLSHRDSRAFARGAGGRRSAQRQQPGPGGAAGGHRRNGERRDCSIRRRGRSARARAARDDHRPARDRATPSGGGRRRPPTASASASKPTSSSRTISRPPATPGRRASGSIDRNSCSPAARAICGDEDGSTRSTAACSKAWRPDPVTVRTFDVDEDQLASRLTRRPLAGGWEPESERGSRQGLRGLRLSLTRPELFQVQLRALLRAARHGSPADHVPVRLERRAGPRGAGDDCAGVGGSGGARHDGAAGAGRGDDRDSGGRLHGRPPGARGRLLHHRHQRSDSVLSGGRSRGRARVANSTSRCIRRSCG